MDKLNNKKTAIVYDKWLATLGGGEVVACNLAQALIDAGYQTTFITGHLVDPQLIKNKLKIDLSSVKFVEIWNDEEKITKLTEGKDIFINASYMDYTVGKAKQNFYYTSFPTKPNNNPRTYIINNILLPIASHLVKPVEFTIPPKTIKEEDGHLLYQIDDNTEVVFSYLNLSKNYLCKFSVYYPLVSKYNLEQTRFQIKNAKVVNKIVKFDHLHNVLHYDIEIKPLEKTIRLKVIFSNISDRAFLINPRIVDNNPMGEKFRKLLEHRVSNRLRAGFFYNIKKRMSGFDTVFANSQYTSTWIKKYWQCDSIVLYPPVALIPSVRSSIKKNYICSVGRFFTLGHGKKQEVMIEAFKKMCDRGLTDWELHLAGGLGNEETSIEFMKILKDKAKGYPIKFHVNVSRKEIEDIYHHSQIYWHAAGFGENKQKDPVKFEHFGIAPIEAISAGCIPILFNGGGLPETLSSLYPQNFSALLFNNISELVSKTEEAITNPSIKKTFTPTPTTISNLKKLYGDQTFRQRFIKLIS